LTVTQVLPASSFATQVKANGGKVAIFNLNRSNGDDKADFLFLGPCETTLIDALDIKDDIKDI
jgi:NAD-dependent deacetylase sirtuin 5